MRNGSRTKWLQTDRHVCSMTDEEVIYKGSFRDFNDIQIVIHEKHSE